MLNSSLEPFGLSAGLTRRRMPWRSKALERVARLWVVGLVLGSMRVRKRLAARGMGRVPLVCRPRLVREDGRHKQRRSWFVQQIGLRLTPPTPGWQNGAGAADTDPGRPLVGAALSNSPQLQRMPASSCMLRW